MKQQFCESKSIFLAFLLWGISTIGFIYYILGDCYPATIKLLPFFAFILMIMFRWIFAPKPYIVIDPIKMNYKEHSFLWPQIQKISLTRRLRSRNPRICLKIESHNEVYWIDLIYFSDDNRRSLLDAIEKYHKVDYEKYKYASNERRWFIFGLYALLVFCIGAYYFHEYITHLK